LDPKSAKGYFRRAQANASQEEFDEAIKDLNVALTHEPNNEGAKAEIKK
jgi:hypothetical protein